MKLTYSSARILLSSGQSVPDLHCRVGGSQLYTSFGSHGVPKAHSFSPAQVSLAQPSIRARGCNGISLQRHPGIKLSPQSRFSSTHEREAPFPIPSRRRRDESHFSFSKGLVRATDADFNGASSLVDTESSELQGWEKTIEKVGEVLSTGFPLWVGLACIFALRFPDACGWINQRVQVVGITITMLGMGMTLTPEDFQGAFAMPKELLAGVVLQYTVMPAAGYAVSRLLQLPVHYAAGLILVACCPGGTASNIVTYLARGNVALSVLMTAASTFLAVVMTPVLTAKLVGQYIAVDAFSLFASTVQVVLLPVIGGAVMNKFFHKFVKKIGLIAPTVAVFIVAIVCAGAVGRSSAAILASGGQVVLAVIALHGAGFFFGFVLARLLGIDEKSSRTISIEVGMQNSVLGVVLAGQHFSNPLTAVPCAVSSVCHSLIGSTLAGFWRLSETKANITQHGEQPGLSSSQTL